MQALQDWHQFIESGDSDLLYGALHEDCVFYSPVVHTPQRGRDLTFAYLSAAAQVLNEDFHYVREVVQGDHAVLEFECVVDGIQVNAVDMITVSDGRIIEFKVMVRPLKAVNKVHERMMLMLQQLSAQA